MKKTKKQKISKEDKVKEELLISLSELRNNYLENIKQSSFSKSYENNLSIIDGIVKKISSLEITQLIEEIKQYIYI